MAAPPRARRKRSAYQGLTCPRCDSPLRHDTLKDGERDCLSCRRPFEAVRFNPVEVTLVVPQVNPTAEGEAPCARHARNAAVANCQRCGQFMCSLCKIESDNKVFCPSCFERLTTEGGLESMTLRVKNYRGLAGGMLAIGVLFWPMAGPLGVASFYYALQGLKENNRKGEEEGTVAYVIIMLLGALWTLGWVGLGFLLFSRGIR